MNGGRCTTALNDAAHDGPHPLGRAFIVSQVSTMPYGEKPLRSAEDINPFVVWLWDGWLFVQWNPVSDRPTAAEVRAA